MPYLIKNAQGQVLGVCANKPGAGNLLPDGSPEIAEFVQGDDPRIAAHHESFSASNSRATALSRLREIDVASIRALREWVVKQPDAPQIIKDREAEAVAEREKLK